MVQELSEATASSLSSTTTQRLPQLHLLRRGKRARRESVRRAGYQYVRVGVVGLSLDLVRHDRLCDDRA